MQNAPSDDRQAASDDEFEDCYLYYDTCWSGSLESCVQATPGIAIAALCFPTAAAAFGLLIDWRGGPFAGISLVDLLMLIPVSIAMLLLTGMMTAVLATLGSFFVLMLVVAVNASFQYPFNVRTQVSIMGVGTAFLFVGTLATLATLAGEFMAIPFGLLAVTMGHIGSLRFVDRPGTLHRLRGRIAKSKTKQVQFRLSYLFVATAWCALIAALTRVIGFNFAVCVFSYGFTQISVLLIDSNLRRRQP